MWYGSELFLKLLLSLLWGSKFLQNAYATSDSYVYLEKFKREASSSGLHRLRGLEIYLISYVCLDNVEVSFESSWDFVPNQEGNDDTS